MFSAFLLRPFFAVMLYSPLLLAFFGAVMLCSPHLFMPFLAAMLYSPLLLAFFGVVMLYFPHFFMPFFAVMLYSLLLLVFFRVVMLYSSRFFVSIFLPLCGFCGNKAVKAFYRGGNFFCGAYRLVIFYLKKRNFKKTAARFLIARRDIQIYFSRVSAFFAF